MDPATGTFLSVDPVVPAYDDPQSLNAYAYAGNNPVNVVDPTGMCGVGPLGIASWGCMNPEVAQALGLAPGYFNASTAFSARENAAQAMWEVTTAATFSLAKMSRADQAGEPLLDQAQPTQDGGILIAQAGNPAEAIAEALEAIRKQLDQRNIDEARRRNAIEIMEMRAEARRDGTVRGRDIGDQNVVAFEVLTFDVDLTTGHEAFRSGAIIPEFLSADAPMPRRPTMIGPAGPGVRTDTIGPIPIFCGACPRFDVIGPPLPPLP